MLSTQHSALSTQIKVCGMREPDNIRAVEQLGVDLMGFICAPKSPRFVEQTPSYLPQKAARVGVFVNADAAFVQAKVAQLGLTKLQLHGSETPQECQTLSDLTGLPIIKALPIAEEADLQRANAYQTCAAVEALLFDTKTPQGGGSGTKFDWRILAAYQGAKPFLLAGGIGLGDEADILMLHHPRLLGIDLNSRFETAPAHKDIQKLEQFISQIKHSTQYGKPNQ